MEQPVKDRVSQGGSPDSLMPMLHGELTGDNGRASPVSVFQECEHVAPVRITEGSKPLVIKN
jgi:hypothetical protein